MDEEYAKKIEQGWQLELVREAAYKALVSVGKVHKLTSSDICRLAADRGYLLEGRAPRRTASNSAGVCRTRSTFYLSKHKIL